MKLEMMGWQCHQPDHMQINCSSLRYDNLYIYVCQKAHE